MRANYINSEAKLDAELLEAMLVSNQASADHVVDNLIRDVVGMLCRKCRVKYQNKLIVLKYPDRILVELA